MNVFVALAEEGVDLNPFKPEFGLYVWTLIALIVVFYALAKFVFPRLGETLADRERRIKEDLERAEQTKQEAEKALGDYKARINQAREEANRMLEESRQSAETMRRELITKAESEARLIVDKTQKELAGERDRAVSELQRQLAVWSAEIASRILDRELDPDSQRELVEGFIRDIGNGRS